MDFTKLLSEQAVLGLVQLALARGIKQQLKDKLHDSGMKMTAWIPLINLVIGYAGFSLMPASAQAASAVATVSGQGLGVLASAVMQNVLVTGVHSSFKNTLFPALKVLLLWGAQKVAKTTD